MSSTEKPGKHEERYSGLEIAVIGMAGRFPAAQDVDAFWRNVEGGVESLTTFTDDELMASGVSPETFGAPGYVRARGILEGAALFDADFFGYTPRDAKTLDPQHRVLLECAWEALENAGYAPRGEAQSVGVFAGCSANLYGALLAGAEGVSDDPAAVGGAGEFLTTRISYKLNLDGPSFTVHTACSTALVAVHLACQSLLAGECEMALAGGVSICVPQEVGYTYKAGGILSSDGRCRPFDAAASGTRGGDGVGLVVLKRLEDAIAANDTVRAVLRGSAINNDARRKIGFTAPSIDGQSHVIRAAQAAAGVDPSTIGYVEAHGTGTRLGDPVEVAALTEAFRAETPKRAFCALGSVKANVGHLNTAAGIAGLIKTVLALEHRVIPPSVNFEHPNPEIPFEGSPFYVPRSPVPWVASESPRRAGVSSFGVGGTNAHVIVEEAPAQEAMASSRRCQILPLAAKSKTALAGAKQRLASHLRQVSDAAMADIAYTLQIGRSEFPVRAALVGASAEGAAEILAGGPSEELFEGTADDRARSLVFVFPSAALLARDPAEDLSRHEPAFRDALNDALTRGAPREFAVSYALARLWKSWGIKPSAVAGFGIGAYAAACFAGVFSIDDAIALARGGGAGARMLAPAIPIRSVATGADVTASQAREVAYWRSEAALEGPFDATRGLDAGTPLVLGREPLGARADAAPFASLPREPGLSESAHALRTLARLWVAGADVAWPAFHAGERRRRVPVPTYSFERQRHWFERPAPVVPRVEPRTAAAVPSSVVDRMSQIWCEAFGLDQVSLDADFFALDGDSFLAVDLLHTISKAFGVDLSLQALNEAPTVRALAAVVDRERSGGSAPAATAIDWNADARLDDAIVPAPSGGDRDASGTLLTGATGYLGAYLLAELLERGRGPVHCLVRAVSRSAALQRIRESLASYGLWRDGHASHIVPVLGDLEQPRLGLSEREFRALAAQIGCIYHAGARVHFLHPYASLRKSNVHGTHEILRLAAEGTRKALHHVSTTAVFPDIAYPDGLIREDVEPTHIEALSTGYAQSKWVAERLVVAARARGIPVTMYRVGTVTGDVRTGICRTDDAIWRIVKGCVQLGMAPSMAGDLSSATVNDVTAAIVHLAGSDLPQGKNYHIVCPRAASWDTIFDTLRDDGYTLARGDVASFRAALEAFGPDNPLYPIAHLLRAMPDERDERPATFDCRNTNAALNGSGIGLAPLDRELLRMYVREFVRTGFLPPPSLAVLPKKG